MECAQCGAALEEGHETCAACGAQVAVNAPYNRDEIHRFLAEANLLRIRKRYDEAISVCTRVLRLDQSNATAHSLMGDIYRDEENYREALGWYKLAVQLEPSNQADRKKLDAMIDRVFQGAKDDEDSVAAPAEPSAGSQSLRLRLRGMLEKLTPTHVIVVFFGFAVIAAAILLLFPPVARQSEQRPPATSETPGTPSAGEPGPLAIPQDSRVIPPDAAGGQVQPGPAKSNDVFILNPNGKQETAGGKKPADKTVKPPTADPGKNASSQVPPFDPPQARRMTIEDVEKETQQLRAALEATLKSSKLEETTLNGLMLDPRSKLLTIEYTIPRIQGGPTETKQGLLYSGFRLIWAADKADSTIRTYVLRGYAYTGEGKNTSLALQADITPQQADAAREAGDYKTVAKHLLNAWWCGDLDTAAF